MIDWTDAVEDLDIELLEMSDDAMDAYAYEHAERLVAAPKATPRIHVMVHQHVELPRAA